MSGQRHTPGPWFVVPPPWGDCTLIVEGSEDPHGRRQVALCDLERWFGITDQDEKEILANARLIAAAPELLEALEYLSHALLACGNSSDCIKVVNAAIAKARGES